jgi:hypothetical protein
MAEYLDKLQQERSRLSLSVLGEQKETPQLFKDIPGEQKDIHEGPKDKKGQMEQKARDIAKLLEDRNNALMEGIQKVKSEVEELDKKIMELNTEKKELQATITQIEKRQREQYLKLDIEQLSRVKQYLEEKAWLEKKVEAQQAKNKQLKDEKDELLRTDAAVLRELEDVARVTNEEAYSRFYEFANESLRNEQQRRADAAEQQRRGEAEQRRREEVEFARQNQEVRETLAAQQPPQMRRYFVPNRRNGQ